MNSLHNECGFEINYAHTLVSLKLVIQVPSTARKPFKNFDASYNAINENQKKKKKLRGLRPRANYTDRAAAAGRRS